ncbi:MAG: GtrA family protein [Clostridiales bacterium]|nr:GtrA family protein [Clostridiales bacterium]
MNIKKIIFERTDNGFIQFLRYIFVGGLAFAADYGVMILLVEGFSFNEILAATVSFVCGLAVNYFLSTFWIFKNSKISNKLAEFLAFALIGVIGLLMNDVIIWAATDILAPNAVFGSLIAEDKYYIIGKIASTFIVFLWNFFARKYIIFGKGQNS